MASALLARAAMLLRLLHIDHDELEAALASMLAPSTPADEARDLLETVQLVLDVHAAAEERVFVDVLSAAHDAVSADAIRDTLEAARRAHEHQRKLLDTLARTKTNSPAWYEHAFDLRTEILDHRWCVDHAVKDLRATIDPDVFGTLAGAYATARLAAITTIAAPPMHDRTMTSWEAAMS